MPYRRTAATQERLDAAREAVLAAAAAVVTEHGWAGCTVAAVADRAGVATGSVYQHVAGKGALLAEVFRRLAGPEVAAVEAALAADAADGTQPADPATRLAAGVRTFAARATRSPRRAWALLAEPVDPLVEAERLAFRRAYRALFAAVVAEGVAAGELPAQDADVTGAAVVGAIGEALVVPLRAGDVPPATVEALVALTLRAAGAARLSS